MRNLIMLVAVIAAMIGTVSAYETNMYTTSLDARLLETSEVASFTVQEGNTYIVTLAEKTPYNFQQASIIAGVRAYNNKTVDTVVIKFLDSADTYTYVINNMDDVPEFGDMYNYPDGTIKPAPTTVAVSGEQHLNGETIYYGKIGQYDNGAREYYQNVYTGVHGENVAIITVKHVKNASLELGGYVDRGSVVRTTPEGYVYTICNLTNYTTHEVNGVEIAYAINSTTIADVSTYDGNMTFASFIETQFTTEATTGFIG